MTSAAQDVLELSRRLQMDLRSAQAKLTELQAMLVALDLPAPERFACRPCRLEFRGPFALAEHRYYAHGEQEPKHWLEAERLAGE